MRCNAMRCDAMGAQPFTHRGATFGSAAVRTRMQACETEASSLVARVRVIASTAQNSRTASTAVGGALPACLPACSGLRIRAFATVCGTHPHVTSTGLEGRAARGRGAQDPEPRERHSAVRSTSQTVQATSSTRRTQGTRRVLRHLRRCVGTNPFRVSARRRLTSPTERGASAGFGG